MEALEKTWQEVLSMEKDTYTLVDTRDELSCLWQYTGQYQSLGGSPFSRG